jgi:hypothetical protein
MHPLQQRCKMVCAVIWVPSVIWVHSVTMHVVSFLVCCVDALLSIHRKKTALRSLFSSLTAVSSLTSAHVPYC